MLQYALLYNNWLLIMPVSIRVISLDADGCIFHSNYQASQHDIISHNQAFLETLRIQNQDFSKVVTVIGSNRQSLSLDLVNGFNGSGSCFKAIFTINEHLHATFCPLLMADIYGGLNEGDAYQRAVTPGWAIENHKESFFDENKGSILYAQMHNIAISHPSANIVFDFYDDRSDILDSLATFFKTYPELMPTNVTLRLNKYNGKENTRLYDIQGTGMIDINYKQTVLDMVEAYIYAHFEDIEETEEGSFKLIAMCNKKLRITDFIEPQLLQNRKPLIREVEEPRPEMMTNGIENALAAGLSIFAASSSREGSGDLPLPSANQLEKVNACTRSA